MKARSFLKLLALMADELVVLILFLLLLPAVGIEVPLTPLLVLVLVLLVKDILIAPYVLGGGAEKRPEIGPESLLGGTAVVVEDLTPDGLVRLNGELWSAKCVNGTARRGEEVVIIGVSGAKVLVERRASPEPAPLRRGCSS
ncbi:NfeD family protein [Thermococcus sp.]|uniref:NfeD family protein n=1 Tax=Thermococcus sp. TaxID=35749 RepID=UPI0026217359|nr:NfeD family protein [Thermococcus sp.]